jgi:hypothetical protein
MIESLPAKPVATDIAISAEALVGFARLQGELAGRSQIVWAEHCSECAYPTCYESCTFYTPRSDLHCRRFAAGIEPVSSAGALGLHRIRFRQWGKLEGRGATSITPNDRARRREGRDARMVGAIAAIPAPYALKRKLAARWNAFKEAEAARPGALNADAFVVETWASDGRRHALTLTMLNLGLNASGLFQVRFEAGPDYQRLTVPLGEIRRLVDLAAPFLIQIEPIGDAAGRDVVFGVCDFVNFKAPTAAVVTEPVAGAA